MKHSQHLISISVRKIANGYVLSLGEGDAMRNCSTPKELFVDNLEELGNVVGCLVGEAENK